jgi:dUTP pyrophosphatase
VGFNIGLQDKRVYTNIFEFDGVINTGESYTFILDEDPSSTPHRGVVTEMFQNRKDELDVHFRILEEDGRGTDYSIHDLTFMFDEDPYVEGDGEDSPFDVVVKFKKLSPSAVIPAYATEGSAGMDFYASEDVWLDPSVPTFVHTGLAVEVPWGFELQLRSRSSMGAKGIMLTNGVGTVDCDYRGEVMFNLINLLPDRKFIGLGERIGQGIVAPAFRATLKEVEDLSSTSRGSGGFGSSGV